ncbi:recombinase family protein [Brevundimonas sp.]|uniref:recombinase family protein n=1 Tax=Brevundimonas sp. TaxID=1871086 RepID=UPI002D70EBE0|nr:recombinase family protein [Brevundimonas sp.]HYC97035.1 recombinase family protein [Brevundimonas sp.]
MKAVAYYRVSTAAQGRSGLGLEAQKAAVADLARQREMTMLAEFTEVESGKRNDRPVLAQALHHARITHATLVIAKLDRLSRNAAFLLTLRDSGVRFLAADVPDANDLTIGVLAVIAQAEREAISRRTKEALAAIKQKIDRGEVHVSARTGRSVHRLGNPNGSIAFGSRVGDLTLAREAKALRIRRRTADIATTVQAIKASGHTSSYAIAIELNRRGVASPRGGCWYPSTAARYVG